MHQPHGGRYRSAVIRPPTSNRELRRPAGPDAAPGGRP
jgi:hypothetical protein